MDALEHDYTTVLLAAHEPPCLSLYQPTHRAHPERQQDPIRFRNLVRELELSLARLDADRPHDELVEPFHRLGEDSAFWNEPLDGIAAFGAADLFRVYRLQRPMRELAIVADSFHTKPLVRVIQSADRYLVLGLDRRRARLFEGNRYHLDEVDLPPDFPATMPEAVATRGGEPERKYRVYGPPAGITSHGTDVRQEEVQRDTERFFRAVDEAVIERQHQVPQTPLLLAALPEHQHTFRSLSRNSSLAAEGIDLDPGGLSLDELRERAWALILPRYLDRLAGFVDRYGAARAKGQATDELNQITVAAAQARLETLLIEADREIPGRMDSATGIFRLADPAEPGVDDLLDDIGERAIRTGAEVVIVPAERMPTETGIAAIFRF